MSGSALTPDDRELGSRTIKVSVFIVDLKVSTGRWDHFIAKQSFCEEKRRKKGKRCSWTILARSSFTEVCCNGFQLRLEDGVGCDLQVNGGHTGYERLNGLCGDATLSRSKAESRFFDNGRPFQG